MLAVRSASRLSADNSFALRWASDEKHWDVLKRLLEDPRIDPSACENVALRAVSKAGHMALVERLLADSRVSVVASPILPTTGTSVTCTGSALECAAAEGHRDILERVMADSRASPAAAAADDAAVRQALNAATAAAAKRGHLDVLNLLLADARTDPAAGDNAAVKAALACRETGTFGRLLEDARVPPPDLSGAGVFDTRAPHRDSVEFARCVITHPRLGPAVDSCRALSWAARQCDWALLEQLLSDPRVHPAADDGLPAALVAQSDGGISQQHALHLLQQIFAKLDVDPGVESSRLSAVNSSSSAPNRTWIPAHSTTLPCWRPLMEGAPVHWSCC